MIYDYKCTGAKCGEITELVQSIKNELPKTIACQKCGKDAIYDWTNLNDNIIIPSKFKHDYVKLDYTKLPQKTYY